MLVVNKSKPRIFAASEFSAVFKVIQLANAGNPNFWPLIEPKRPKPVVHKWARITINDQISACPENHWIKRLLRML